MTELVYFVDERSGCVAVRDRTKTDPDYSGLHEDTDGVVKFWGGYSVTKKCPTCGHERSDGWEMKQEDIDEAEAYCDKLNAQEDTCQK